VATLEHRTHVVETRDAGGHGRCGRVRVCLHHAQWLQLDTCRPTSCRGAGEAAGVKRILRHDQAIRGGPLLAVPPGASSRRRSPNAPLVTMVKPFLLPLY
jgi:hypothetical protein